MIKPSAILLAILALAGNARAVTIDTVPVGNPGNAADTTGFGAVGYNYRIGKTEVTNTQYAEFLNAKAASDPLGLYWEDMGSKLLGGISQSGTSGSFTYSVKTNMGNKPVNYIDSYDAIRFANWMNNGQGTGDTETGAYRLEGGTRIPSNSSSITREPGATWFLPNENEWYKAAYHKNDGASGNYWDYPTSHNHVPYSDDPPGDDAPDPSNTANFRLDDFIINNYNDGFATTRTSVFLPNQQYLTDVGAYTLAPSPYGTYDQGGNVYEWFEMLVASDVKGVRGGSWMRGPGLAATEATYGTFGGAFDSDEGFRVATVPEPPSSILAVLSIVGLAAWGWRRKR